MGITKLIQDTLEHDVLAAYETDVTSISNIFAIDQGFSLNFVNEDGSIKEGECFFRKYDNTPLLILCWVNKDGKNWLKEITEEITVSNANFKYLFRIQPVKNDEKKKQEELFYPFTPGKGIQQCLKIYEESSISSNNNKEQSKDNSNNIGDNKSQNKNKNNRENFENSQNSTEKNSGENEEDSIYTEQIVNGKENILFKFTTKKYFINMEGKKRRKNKKR